MIMFCAGQQSWLIGTDLTVLLTAEELDEGGKKTPMYEPPGA